MAVKVKHKKFEGKELDILPFVNFMISIIPILIMSVEFAKISIISIKLPEGRGSQTNSAVTQRPEVDESNKLLLTAVITDSVVTLGAKGGFLPSLWYREFHKYITRDDNTELTVEYKPGEIVKHPKTGRPLTIYERHDIYLYVTDENRNFLNCMYTKNDQMLVNADGMAVTETKIGDTVYTVSNPRMMIVVSNPAEYKLRPLSAYDELRNRLMKVKERFREADDANDIIIAAENEVMYDKIVQIMDAARAADFPNISIAKLRG
jgi:biopolymer transport protein ExbD